ncbi:phage capsid protein [Azospirillum sp. sgz302134]
MSAQITTAFVQQYRAGFETLVGQKTSRLRKAVREESETGKRISFDQVGHIQMTEKTGRNVDIPIIETPHFRRWLANKDYIAGQYVDDFDKLKVLTDPTNAYSQAFSSAGARKLDHLIVQAGLGTAYSGEEGTVPVPFPDTQKIEADGTGFTLTKLMKAVEMLKTMEAIGDDASDEIHLALTAKLETGFINTNEVKSSDFTTVRVLEQGGVEKFYRVIFHRFEDFRDKKTNAVTTMLPKAGTVRSCMLWVKSGILLNVTKDVKANVDWIAQKQSYLVSAGLSAGAVRMEEEKVVQIDCEEGA